jgi:hypothetical protein
MKGTLKGVTNKLVKRQKARTSRTSVYFRSHLFLNQVNKAKAILNEKDSLDDADLVGNVEGVIVGGQANVRLLLTVGTHQGVHLGHVDVVQLLHRGLDLVLVGLITKK